MRGDLSLQLRLALRHRRGLVGTVVTAASLTAVLAVYLPWYQVIGEVTMLATTRRAVVADLAGWEAHPWVWLVAATALVGAAIGVAVAVDRPPRWSRTAVLVVAATIAATSGLAALVTPPRDRFLADDDMQRWQAVVGRVPEDVEVSFEVATAVGPWVALAAAALLLAAVAAAREV